MAGNTPDMPAAGRFDRVFSKNNVEMSFLTNGKEN